MPYLKPAAFTRNVVNPVVSRLHTGGVETLTVTGRSSGKPRSVPVIPVAVRGERYLVAPFGESDWVRNLRVAGRATLRGHDATGSFSATEVPAGERADIVAAYRSVAGRTVERCFVALPDPADHPVFRLRPDAPAGG
ncbi:MAG: nitroreductase family deazaflavin-dependent oxidoreductase [Blastococcus sp.]